MDTELITAAEYLEAEERARRSSDDHSALQRIQKELDGLPDARERLALEFLALGLRALEVGTDPWSLIILATYFARTIREPNRAELLRRLRVIIFRLFELMAYSTDDFRLEPQFGSSLTLSLIGLRRIDEGEYHHVFATLKSRCGPPERDPRVGIIAESDELPARMDARIRRLARQVNSVWKLAPGFENWISN
jgi:hypothetical protein